MKLLLFYLSIILAIGPCAKKSDQTVKTQEQTMETFNVEILNPKAKCILMNLAELKLITIKTRTDFKKDFLNLLQKLRSKAGSTPSLDEITKEVEYIRKGRYAG